MEKNRRIEFRLLSPDETTPPSVPESLGDEEKPAKGTAKGKKGKKAPVEDAPMAPSKADKAEKTEKAPAEAKPANQKGKAAPPPDDDPMLSPPPKKK
jgi:hypothetical protein